MKTHRETTRATWRRRLLQAAGLAIVAASVTAASCGKTNDYHYVEVSVYVDPNSISKQAFLDPANIDSCEMYVTGSETSPAAQLPCTPSQPDYPGLGKFQWSTTLSSGTIQFTVTLYALNRVVYAMGTKTVQIMPGEKQQAVDLVVTLVPTDGMPGTGGAGGGTGTGGVTGTGGIAGLGGAGGGSGGMGGKAGSSGSGGAAGAGGMPGTGGAAGRGGSGGSGGRGGAGGTPGVGGSSSGGAGGAGTAGAGGDAGGAGGS